ncbi:glycosyltransferase family 2 protein [Halomonas sp. LBP4]|uniref:glycosyltransferase family 2 protein n=1 Tax=Halomonas sp. LBP4 TaxID=2044917 RepID=UPI000D7692DA|nr:glycosyltransferase family 2 protein [Halomonas sp. LBP4]PXX97503.1 glycosyl transferase family 2 [Halomonas sp. LBP4]
MKNWSGDTSSPLVSILCITYNHAGFISRAIESFLMQEVDFPYEIVIHDDASIDGTTEIIRQYQAMYPHIIKPIIQVENQYSKGNDIFDIIKRKAIGKYLALCEGDDYWTDPHKLKIQCSYLDHHPEIVVTGHNACSLDSGGNIVVASRLPKKHQRDYKGEELSAGQAWMLNLTLVCRNVDFGYVPEKAKLVNHDKFLVSLLGSYGGSHYHPEISPACHIKHAEGAWTGIDTAARNEAQINSWFWIYKYYSRLGMHEYADTYWSMYLRKVFAHSSRKVLLREFLIKMLFAREIHALIKKLK